MVGDVYTFQFRWSWPCLMRSWGPSPAFGSSVWRTGKVPDKSLTWARHNWQKDKIFRTKRHCLCVCVCYLTNYTLCISLTSLLCAELQVLGKCLRSLAGWTAFNGSFLLQHFEHGNMIKIRNGIMLDFYPRLPWIECEQTSAIQFLVYLSL